MRAPVSRGLRLGGETTAVMGILNVTPDSFSDGGLWFESTSAIDQGLRLADEGALIVDVGGESTRPGATRVPMEEEWRRITGVINTLVARGVIVSVDTVRGEVARRAVEEGAMMINDVSGGRWDPRTLEVAAATGVAMVVQHWRGFPSDPALDCDYEEVVPQVRQEMETQIAEALNTGVQPTSLVIDPGLGFAKRSDDSWTLVSDLGKIVDMGYPTLIGASRKRFVRERFPHDVDAGTRELTGAAVRAKAWAVRVHDVAGNVRVIEDLSRG